LGNKNLLISFDGNSLKDMIAQDDDIRECLRTDNEENESQYADLLQKINHS
jgi:hypothetical protein